MTFSTSSRIPHLARAIVEKRQLRLDSSHTKYHEFVCQIGEDFRKCHNTRRYASSAQPQRQKGHSRTTVGPKYTIVRQPISPLAVEQPPRPPSPPPYGVELPSEDDEKYDPSKDPVRLGRYRKAKLGFTLVVAGFVAYVYQSYQHDVKRYYASGKVLEQDADVSDRWKDATRNFDREVDDAEMIMLLKWKRKRLVRKAYGDVLEVSVGTGRNMDLYDTRPYSATESSSYGRDTRHMITSLTFNDESPVMIENAKKKWDERQKKRRIGDRFGGKVNWYTGDAGRADVIPRPAGGYDTIIQSWGICSMTDPIKFLRHLGRLVRQPDEKIVNSSPQRLREQEEEDGKGGRIFLLEHGRGKYDWLNNFLDKSAPMHAERYGCWYNKDIDKVIRDSGLVVESVRRYNFGTTYEYILRPAPGPLPGEEDATVTQTNIGVDKASTGGWFSSLWK